MADLLFWPAIMGLVGVAALAIWWRIGLLTDPDVRAFRAIGRHYGLVDARPLVERVGDRIPWVRFLHRETNIPRLLALAGDPTKPSSWGLRTAGMAFLAMALTMAMAQALDRSLGATLPPGGAVLIGLGVAVFEYLRLRQTARARQQQLDLAIRDTLPELILLTSAGGLAIDRALPLLAGAHEDLTLAGLLEGESWRALVPPEEITSGGGRGRGALTSSASIYAAISRHYGIPALGDLASNMRRMLEKSVDRGVLVHLTRRLGQNELAEQRRRAYQAGVYQVAAMTLMVLPLLGLIGFPLVLQLARAL